MVDANALYHPETVAAVYWYYLGTVTVIHTCMEEPVVDIYHCPGRSASVVEKQRGITARLPDLVIK